MIYALIAALLEAADIIGTKIVLGLKHRINYKTFYILIFFFLFLFSLVLCPFYANIQQEFFSAKYLLVFIAMICTAIGWNLLYYRALHEEKLVEFELVTLTYPLAAIFLASIFIPKDFSVPVFLAGIVGAIALMLAHLKRKHLSFSKMKKKLLLTVLFMAVETILIDYLLDVINPVMLYTIRTGVIFVLFLIIFRNQIKNIIWDKTILYYALLAILAIGFNISAYISYKVIGVSFSILVLILTPVIVFMYAYLKEKEKMNVTQVLAASIILLCIAYAYLSY